MNSKWIAFVAAGLLAAVSLPAQGWRQIGPPGGTVISLEQDPRNPNKLYLGTQDGHVFTSNDEGGHWQILSRIGANQNDVITHILVDSRDSSRLYASTWTLSSGGGGVYKSTDSGQTWQVIGLAHETVRALAQAPTNPKVFVAGSLTGVYRSTDDGATWQLITPPHHEDLQNFDSVAFDPRDENIIYAGTYHLPWKTTDGGKNWVSIGKGMIDDSDVMSIVVDPANPESVHATACSGIYHSTNGAQQWSKYKGIPFEYRRTQLIRQDPAHPETLYAGTTSGLWKTTNEGGEWKRMTPLDWVVNALVIDPREPSRIIIGTEREGVQVSENGAASFRAANDGFEHQHILDVAIDPLHPEHTLVELTFDTNAFLETKDHGTTWVPLGTGLKRTDTKRVYATPTGWWASLNNGGWMKYDATAHKWLKTGSLVTEVAVTTTTTSKSTRPSSASKNAASNKNAVTKKTTYKTKTQPMLFPVNDMAFTASSWFAATADGVLISRDHGATWKEAAKEGFTKEPAQSLEASEDGSQVWVVAQHTLLYSADGGTQWDAKSLPIPEQVGDLRLHRVSDTNLFLTSNMGLYGSRDAGRNWAREDIRGLQFQGMAGSGNALFVSQQKHGLYESVDSGRSWQPLNNPLADGYFPLVQAERNGTFVAASATEGLLMIEPQARSAENAVDGNSGLAPDSGGTSGQKPRH